MDYQYIDMTEKADKYYSWKLQIVSEGQLYIRREYIRNYITYMAERHFEKVDYEFVRKYTTIYLVPEHNFTLDEFLWLPESKNYQRLLGINIFGLEKIVSGFADWVQEPYNKSCRCIECINKNPLYPFERHNKSPIKLFTSYEAMWQAYYMQKEHNRIWNGGDYVKII